MSLIPYKKFQHLNVSILHKETVYFKNNKLNVDAFPMKLKKNGFKPEGLWFSCGPSWFKWCMENVDPYWVVNKKVYNIIINEKKILNINTISKLNNFIEKYSEHKKTKKNFEYTIILWSKVSKEYSGIKFCPYLRGKIPISQIEDWYYSLDAASGCIWNPDCIIECEYGGILPKYNLNEKKIVSKFNNILQNFNS